MNKKKVGILTFHRSNNYGALYQAYALSTFLRHRGHEPFIVNYHEEVPSVRAYLAHPLSFVGKILGKRAFSLAFVLGKIAEKRSKDHEKQFDLIFEDFRRLHLPITSKVYDDEALERDCPDADVFIAGSDQIWAADFVFSSPAYLLGFAPKNARRVSYAPSFGKAYLEFYLRPVFREHITKFDAVSVREKTGVDLIREIAGIEAALVVDPTLLLTSYAELVDYSLVPDNEYLLTYRLAQGSQVTHWMSRCLDAISSAADLPLYVVSTNAAQACVHSGISLQPTPGQLLGLIERSSFFATNSFHGTVFALLLKADFLTFARDTAPNKQNLRLTDLLSTVGLESRYCPPGLDISEVLAKTKLDCNYEQAHEALSLLRARSSSFLDQALK